MINPFSLFIYGAGELLARLVSFISVLVLARTLSKGEYGLLESHLVTVGVLVVVGGAGLNSALQAFYFSKAEYLDVGESRRISTAFYSLLIWQFSFMVFGILIVVSCNLTKYIDLALLLPCIALLTTQLQLMQDVFRLRFQPTKYLASTLLSKGGVAIVSSVIVLMGGGVNEYLWSYLLGLLVSSLLVFYFLRDDLRQAPHPALAKEMLRYGLPFVLVGVGSWVVSSLDRWLLASWSGLSSVGEYAFAVRIGLIVSFLSIAFGQYWSPMVFKIKESRPADYLAIYSDTFLTFTLAITILAAAISIFSPEFQNLIFHNEYHEAVPAILLLCFTAVVQSTTHFTAIGISLSRKTYYFAMCTWLAAALSLLGNCILIPYWGVNAAALMNFCSTALLSLLYFVISQREHRMRFAIRDVGWFILLISYLFIGSAVIVLTSIPFVSIVLKIVFLIPATIGSIIFLQRMMLRYAR